MPCDPSTRQTGQWHFSSNRQASEQRTGASIQSDEK